MLKGKIFILMNKVMINRLNYNQKAIKKLFEIKDPSNE